MHFVRAPRCLVFRLLPGIVLVALTAGCATNSSNYALEIDSDAATAIVAAGYFDSAQLRRQPPCGPFPPELEGVIDCFLTPGQPLSRARFVIDQVFLGQFTGRKIQLHFVLYRYLPPVLIGPEHRQLVVIRTDGRSHVLEGYAPVARTLPGGWAIPTPLDDADPAPCSDAKLDFKPVQFAAPRPRTSVRSVARGLRMEPEEIAELRDELALTMKAGHLYPTQGIVLEDVIALYSSMSSQDLLDRC